MTPDMKIYTEAIRLAHVHEQTVGEKNDYYITLEQLERLCIAAQEPN